MIGITLLITIIPLLTAAWWLWADRRLRTPGIHRGWRIGVAVVTLLILTGYAWVLLGRRDVLLVSVPPTLYALVLLWSLLFLPLMALPMMAGWSIWKIGARLVRRKPQITTDKPGGWTRRKWLTAALVSLPQSATIAATAYSLAGIERFRIREISVNVPDLPTALDGVRIAHLTDTHVGKFTRGAALEAIVATTNELRADLVLFTGDLIDNTLRDLPDAVRMLQRMQPAEALFLIEGNHDLFDDPAAFVAGVRDGGLALLRDEAATVEIRGVPVQILGITWHHNADQMNATVDAVAKLRDPAAFPILLAHHPHAFDRAAEHGFPLVLAGHTHGGQLMLTPEIGAGPLMFRYWSGLYRKLDSALVVGNGTGNWFPLRVHAPAEIVHLTLRRA